MANFRQNRVDAFTAWLRTIDGQPPFHQRPEFRFFADLSPEEFERAAEIMQKEGEQLNADADELKGQVGATVYIGSGFPPFLGDALEDAIASAAGGPVTVYRAEQHRRHAEADEVASAAISASWDGVVRQFGIGPSREDHLKAALMLLDAADAIVRKRLAGGEAA